MGQSHSKVLKHAARTLAGGVIVAATALATATTASAAPCPNIDVAPTADNAASIRTAVLCLSNAERTDHGLPALRENSKLRKAALAHSGDMVSGGYFAHTAPDGATFVDRILTAGYTRRNDGWSLGENLAWGTGDLGTARGVHDAWMKSKGHKANILNAAYREIGIGIRTGVPSDAEVGATNTTELGVKL
jgi:uncharacterized protein YkwD